MRLINLIAVLLIGYLLVYLWIFRLDEHYFTQDNAYHLLLASKLNWNWIDHIRWDTHPPLYYLLLKCVISLAGGDNPLLLRSVSLFAGILTVIFGFLLGKDLSKKTSVGLVVAFLLVTAPLLVLQSQNVRNYSLLLCIIFALLLLFQRESLKARDFGVGGVLFLCLTFTHYASVIFLPTFILLGLLKLPKNFLVKKKLALGIAWLAFLSANGLLTFWMSNQHILYQSGKDGHILELKAQVGRDLLKVGPLLWQLLQNLFGSYSAWISAILISCGLARLLLEKKNALLILFWGPLLTGLSLALLDAYPLTSGRHSIYLLPIFLVPMVWALKWFCEKSSLFLIIWVALIVIAQWVEYPNIYQIDKWRSHANYQLHQDLFWELGPQFTEMEEVRRNLKEEMGRGPASLILDWDFRASLRVEKEIRPVWAIFQDLGVPIGFCGFFDGSPPPCSCLRETSKMGHSYFFALKRRLGFLIEQMEKEPCFDMIVKREMSKNTVLLTLRPKAQSKP